MRIPLTYGENGECVLDTSFSLFFVHKCVEQGLLSKGFLKSLASGELKIENETDFLNMPYCCYLNGTPDPMTKQEFDERYILDVRRMTDLFFTVLLGDATDSKMKNVFRVKPDPKKQ